MFNRSKIEWCDFTWNPVTGCTTAHTAILAAKQTRRFSGDVRLNKSSDQLKRRNGLYILESHFKNQIGKLYQTQWDLGDNAQIPPTIPAQRRSRPICSFHGRPIRILGTGQLD